jgi:hypothetical protein
MYASQQMVFGIQSASGYESAAVQRTVGFWRVVSGEKAADVSASPLQTSYLGNYLTPGVRYDLLPRAGVTTIYAPPNLMDDPAWKARGSRPLSLTARYSGPDGKVFGIDAPVERAFVVHRAAIVGDEATALARYTEPAFPWRRQVVLERDQADAATRGSGAPTAADSVHQGLNGTSWRVQSSSPGWLVLLDSWAPGWHATVNGHDAKVLHADYAFRAVELPAGTSTVRFVYRPAGWVLGSVVSLALVAGIGVAGVVTLARRRARRNASVSSSASGVPIS